MKITRHFSPSLALAAALACLNLSPVQPARAEASNALTPGKPSASLENLNQKQLQEAFRTLSQHYIEKETLGYDELNRAALEGLLHRLNFGATLADRKTPAADQEPPAEFRFHHELIPPRIGYIRPVYFSGEEISQTKAALKEFHDSEADTVILDLRAPVVQNELAPAAAFADLFTPDNILLFKIAKADGDRPELFLSKKPSQWDRDVVLLIDAECSSAAETAAAAIAQERGTCLVVGQKTQGRTVQYEEIALSEDTALRFASAQVRLPDESTLFRTGISPQINTLTRPADKRRVFEESQGKESVAQFIFDHQRPRMNEAALVSGDNPELEYYLAKTAGKQSVYDRRQLQDRALQQTVELLQTIDFLRPGEAPPETAPAKEPPTAQKDPNDKETGEDPSPTD